jgi:hypothetical protein
VKGYVIQASADSARYVHSFNETNKLVVLTKLKLARVFRNEHLAQQFIDSYADAGFGLSRRALVVPYKVE